MAAGLWERVGEIQRGAEQHHRPAGSWASAGRLEIQLGLGWIL